MNTNGIFRVPRALRLAIKQEYRNRTTAVKKESLTDIIKNERTTETRPRTENCSELSFKVGPVCVDQQEPISKAYQNQTVAVKQDLNKTELTTENSSELPFKVDAACEEKQELPEDTRVPSSGILKKPSIVRRRKKRLLQRTGRAPYRRPLFTAIYIHKILMSKDPASLSNRQLNSLTWAEKVIVKDTLRKAERAARYQELNKQISRRPKKTRSFMSNVFGNKKTDDAYSDTLQLVVVDFGMPGGRYSFEQGKMIEKAIGKAVVNHILKNLGLLAPTFGTVIWHDGVIILDCKNRISYDFAKYIISNTKLWAGSELKAVPPEEIPFKSKGRLYIPDLGIETEQVLDVLKCQNPLINMKKWKIFKEYFSINGSNRYTVLITDPPVTLLQNKQLRLFFGAGKVTLKLLGCNWPDEVQTDSEDEVILVTNEDISSKESQEVVMNTADDVILVIDDDIFPQINYDTVRTLDEVILLDDEDTSSQPDYNAAQGS